MFNDNYIGEYEIRLLEELRGGLNNELLIRQEYNSNSFDSYDCDIDDIQIL